MGATLEAPDGTIARIRRTLDPSDPQTARFIAFMQAQRRPGSLPRSGGPSAAHPEILAATLLLLLGGLVVRPAQAFPPPDPTGLPAPGSRGRAGGPCPGIWTRGPAVAAVGAPLADIPQAAVVDVQGRIALSGEAKAAATARADFHDVAGGQFDGGLAGDSLLAIRARVEQHPGSRPRVATEEAEGREAHAVEHGGERGVLAQRPQTPPDGEPATVAAAPPRCRGSGRTLRE